MMKTSAQKTMRGFFASTAVAIGIQLITTNLSAQQTAPAPEEPADDAVELPEFTTTGSRIKRLDAETVSPVIELRTGDLQKVGFPTLGDALRSMPFNSGQALTPTDSGTSFTPGVSTINLRGLGNNQTLILVNGRRTAPYASPGFDGFQTMFDLNSIPEVAIESIEILKDGGSAIYGSDAVAGVVNVKLRKDYEGAAASFKIGNYVDTNGFLKQGSLLFGTANDRTSITTTLDWQEQEAVQAADLSYSRNSDKTNIAHKANPKYRVDGWADVGFSSEQEYLDETLPLIGFVDPITDGYMDQSSSRGYPGYITMAGIGRRTFRDPDSTPTTGEAVNGVNYYNFQETAGLFPEYRRYSFYTQLRHEFSDNLYAFTEVSFARYETESLAAATPVDIETSHGLDSQDPMVYPGFIPYDYAEGEAAFQNPFNPWGVDAYTGRRRLVELPNRINDITSETPRVLVGLGGDLGDVNGLGNWTWESGALYSKNTVVNLNRGSAGDARLQQAFYGLTRLANGTLTWDPSTHPRDRVYFNWFGRNETAFADFLEIENPTTDSISLMSWDASLTGNAFELPAGMAGFALGGELRKEKLESISTDLNATGGILGGSEGTSSFGNRTVYSVYAELSLPILKQLEVNLAARYEDYSDKGFETDIRPKISFKYRPTNWLIVRGSYSESFKAPDLAYLYTSSTTTFTSGQIPDPITGNAEQIQTVVGGNPNLEPETTDTWYAGIVYEAPKGSFLEGFEASVDYFIFDQENLLSQLTDVYDWGEFLERAAAGDPIFADKVFRDPVSNDILYVRDDYANISTGKYKGFDFGLRYRWETENLGTFTSAIDATMLDELLIDGSDIVGGYLTAKWNGTASLSWTKGDYAANIYGVYRGERERNLSLGTVYEEGDTLILQYTVKPQTTFNASFSYSGLQQTTITVGVNNLFNSKPPVDPFDGTGTTAGVNDPFPSFWWIKLDRLF